MVWVDAETVVATSDQAAIGDVSADGEQDAGDRIGREKLRQRARWGEHGRGHRVLGPEQTIVAKCGVCEQIVRVAVLEGSCHGGVLRFITYIKLRFYNAARG